MNHLHSLGLLTCALLAAQTNSTFADEALANWGQWRGPLGTGLAPQADPPSEWSETKNVKWKSAIPGEGSSTPVVWGNRVFILTAVKVVKPAEAKAASTTTPAEGKAAEAKPPGPGGEPLRRGSGGPGGAGGKATDAYQFTVFCYDRATGKTLWQKIAKEEVPHEGRQQDNTFASASPVTDGEVVLAYFGSRGLHCYDMAGNLKWSKELGHMVTRNGFGEGASPALHGNTVVINWDDETDNDFIAAFDKQTGKELWRKPRNEATGWSTPLILEGGKKTEVVVNASGKVRSYDLANGDEIWSCGGQTANAIPSPVADKDTIYVTSGFRGAALFAITRGKTGDLTGTEAIRWSFAKGTPYVPSPLLANDFLYVLSGNNGMLSCFDAKKGTPLFETERLEGAQNVYASPVAAKDKVYVLGRNGSCVVLKLGAKPEIVATNKLDDRTDASIAMAGKELFIRGRENLYCIAEK